MMMPRPMIVEQPMIVNPGVARMGLLKLHVVEAHLSHNTNPGLFERMDPFVIIKVNLQEWRSAVCMGGGGGMMKGAMMGAMIATDVAIMEHESHNNRHHNTRVVVVENNGRRH